MPWKVDHIGVLGKGRPEAWDAQVAQARTDDGRLRMKAIVVTEESAGGAGMTLTERPEPPAAINDVIVRIHASGFVSTELAWPSTWTDRAGRNRTPRSPATNWLAWSPPSA